MRLEHATDHDVRGALPLRGGAEHLGDMEKEVVVGDRRLGRELQQTRLGVQIGQPSERLEPILNRSEDLHVGGLGSIDHPLVDAAVLADGETHPPHGGAHVDQLETDDWAPRLPRAGRRDPRTA